MKRTETNQGTNRLETKDVLIIAKGEDGYRVCSPLTPARQYIVSGIPSNPQCTCADFIHPDRPPDWQCEHILAVLNEVNGTNRAKIEGSPTPAGGDGSNEPPSHNGTNGNGKSPRDRKSTGVVMLLKRSVSPDGRIDSLSVEFTCPIGTVTTGGIKELAQAILALQSEITAGFLRQNRNSQGRANGNGNGHTNGNGGKPQNGDVNVPNNAVPGQLLAVASMNSRRGRLLFLNVMVNGQVLKMFGSEKQLAEAVSNAGYSNVAAYLVDGYTLNLPCRVITKPNGKYINVERVYPPQAGVPVEV
jgi:hypothetical protein